MSAHDASRVTNLLLVGVGGQGIVLASRILCQAALGQGLQVAAFESHGMAQRGGAVSSRIRFGPRVRTALIPEAGTHLLVALEPVEALRYRTLLGQRTAGVVNLRTQPPISVSSKRDAHYPSADETLKELGKLTAELRSLDGSTIAEELGNRMLLSTVMIGAAWGSGQLGLDRKPLIESITDCVPERHLDANLQAFEQGAAAVGG